MPAVHRRPRRLLLISNTVMHYRVAVYNYFAPRFLESGYEWKVLTNELQPANRIPCRFPIEERSFSFREYRRRILEYRPDAVILFLHLKDRVLWPLFHWLKLRRIPTALWTKTRNLDAPNNHASNAAFFYLNSLSDALILYSSDLNKYLTPRQQRKAFVANNTINQHDFPAVTESKAQIKQAFGIPYSKVVLFVGRMGVDGGRKRVDHLIEIFRDPPMPDAGLVIVGSGMREEWKRRINPRTTMYLGEVQDPENRQIARLFSMADVCAIPGHVGLGLNQALYYGLPVVTMEGKQPPEIQYLHHGRNGFIVPQGDVSQLRERIFDLLRDPEMLRNFSICARRTFIEEASIEAMFQGFVSCADFLTANTSKSG